MDASPGDLHIDHASIAEAPLYGQNFVKHTACLVSACSHMSALCGSIKAYKCDPWRSSGTW